ncbi:hypothetical protein V493_00890 [Pseudogymnoascus sp. VKM F-4281 (FW-2241)]|nr:hypothetical protein V493_00890 [Pseudogymnoascus sp. VKM F-4281 (FW-2241)]
MLAPRTTSILTARSTVALGGGLILLSDTARGTLFTAIKSLGYGSRAADDQYLLWFCSEAALSLTATNIFNIAATNFYGTEWQYQCSVCRTMLYAGNDVLGGSWSINHCIRNGRNGSEMDLHSAIWPYNVSVVVGWKKRGGRRDKEDARKMLGRWQAGRGARGARATAMA